MARLAPLLAVLLSLSLTAAHAAESVLHHVHGLAFSADGKTLMVPAHIGLAVYRGGKWARTPGPAHDFMGFSAAEKAIYSSGHPAPDSPLRNPLGLMKSTDGGATWRELGLSGESDFHLMAAGYRSHAVYVVNPEPSSRMREPGLHFTRDDGKSWTRSAAAGLAGRITSIAVHPTDEASVAIGTLEGLYVSHDSGARFARIGPLRPVSAVLFDFDGKRLFFAHIDGDRVQHISVDGRSEQRIRLPKLERDFVIYISQNPAQRSELAVATRQRNVFLSTDAGKTWKQIAREGNAV